MPALRFEMSDYGVWYAEVGVSAEDFHAFKQTGCCGIVTHIAQVLWFPMGSAAELRCGEQKAYGMVTGVRTGMKTEKLQVTLSALTEDDFDGVLGGSLMRSGEFN